MDSDERHEDWADDAPVTQCEVCGMPDDDARCGLSSADYRQGLVCPYGPRGAAA